MIICYVWAWGGFNALVGLGFLCYLMRDIYQHRKYMKNIPDEEMLEYYSNVKEITEENVDKWLRSEDV